MWQSSNTIRAGHMPHIALRCLEGSTMSNLVHRRRRCARIVTYMELLPGGQYARGWALEDCHMQGKSVYSCLSPWGGW